MEAYNPYRFNSKRSDPATGVYDFGFRDYSPGLNRFLTEHGLHERQSAAVDH